MSDWELRRKESLDQAAALLHAEPRLAEAVQVVTAWLPCLKWSQNEETGLVDLDDRANADLINSLSIAGMSEWGKLFSRRFAEQSYWSTDSIAIDLLVGLAAGTYFASSPSRTALAVVTNALEGFRDGWCNFVTTAADRFLGDGRKNVPLLVEFLAEQVNSFTAAPRRIAGLNRTKTCAMSEEFRRNPRLRDLWREAPYYDAFALDCPMVFDILRRVDVAAFIKLLDRFPHPAPVRQIVEHCVQSLGIDETIDLFEKSPCGFDRAGEWLVQSKTPFIILSCLMSKLSDLIVNPGDENASLNGHYSRASTRIIATISKREDAIYFGHAWLQQLLSDDRFWVRRRVHEQKTAHCDYLVMLVEAAKAIPQRPNVLSWVCKEEEIWQRNRAVAAIAIVASSGDPDFPALRELVWSILDCIDLPTTGIEEVVNSALTPEHWLMGFALSQLPDLPSFFGRLWRDLAAHRDRGRHWVKEWEDPSVSKDIILISWFLCGLNHRHQDTDEAKHLWCKIHLALKEISLTQAFNPRSWTLKSQYFLLARLLVVRLRHSISDTALNDLKNLLESFLCLDIRLALLLNVLRQSETPVCAIIDAVENPSELLALLEGIEEEQALRNGFSSSQVADDPEITKALRNWITDFTSNRV